MARDYNFWVYIVTNRSDSVLYIGVTNRLSRRTWEHREGAKTGFASMYRCKKLIYYEHYRDAIARESQLKKWSCAKKIGLINRFLDCAFGSARNDRMRAWNGNVCCALKNLTRAMVPIFMLEFPYPCNPLLMA
ncbi:MAG TPA: GIY-YIG nuclease family protein [Candidatus Udaeobacter sp.]|jgi:putative endonuclease|nr:GIY-YIG nuclease family protein [Candidatus Udaeobacter sp.]